MPKFPIKIETIVQNDDLATAREDARQTALSNFPIHIVREECPPAPTVKELDEQGNETGKEIPTSPTRILTTWWDFHG